MVILLRKRDCDIAIGAFDSTGLSVYPLLSHPVRDASLTILSRGGAVSTRMQIVSAGCASMAALAIISGSGQKSPRASNSTIVGSNL
ncbi:MAG: hypothetical protein RR672_03205 [Raoultibacter sp.]